MITKIRTRNVDFNERDDNIREDHTVKLYIGCGKFRIKLWEYSFSYKANDIKSSSKSLGFKSSREDDEFK